MSGGSQKLRQVVRLQWAKPCERPSVLPKRKVDYRNPKAVGLRFERKVGLAIKELRLGPTLQGQWFEFTDANGHGYCQPDVIVELPDMDVIFECKLTDVEEAQSQLEGLYVPVVSRAFRRPARGVIVARYLTCLRSPDRVVDSVQAALGADPAWLCPILHWIGRGPIGHAPVSL